MRENESDGAGGWWQSPEQDAGTRRPGPGAAPRRTATTRTPSPSARRQGVPAPGTREGTGTRAATGRATTATRMDTRARAATGTRPAATEAKAAEPDPAGRCPIPRPGRRSPRGGRLLVYVAVAALAAGIGAGATVAFGGHSPAPAAGVSSSDVPDRTTTRRAAALPRLRSTRRRCGRRWIRAWSTSCRPSSSTARRPRAPG
jgi:hypothetical protein